MKYVEESGMRFGPFDEEALFCIEKSEIYEKINFKMKIAEFVTYSKDKNQLLFVEAKSSAPNPNNASSEVRFSEFITEIEQKLCNAFDLYLNQALRKETPSAFLQIDYRNCEIVLVLVIKGHEEEWLDPVRSALENQINKHLRMLNIWKCHTFVLNETIARAKNLISD